MENIVKLLPYILLGAWFLFSCYYLRRANRNPERSNPYIYDSIPQIFPTIGILGTFIGIAYGLHSFDVKNIETSIPALLDGLKSAFYASIGGIVLSIVFSKFTAKKVWKDDKAKISPETAQLMLVVKLLTEMKLEFSENFVYIDEYSNKVKPANVLRDICEESRKQSQALQSFSTDLSIKIEAGFDTIMSNQIQNGVIPQLQAVQEEIKSLGLKLNDPTTEMTQNVVKDLQSALGSMIDEFKTSMSGSTKSELENLTSLLNKAGGSLLDFPDKLQFMTDNLSKNFRDLQDVISNISEQTLTQSGHSTDQMKKQVEDMSEILKSKVGDLQVGQEVLIGKQAENLKISDKLLDAFNVSIERMNGLSKEIAGTIHKFSEVKSELTSTAVQLRSVSENVNMASGKFKDGQLEFSVHSNDFLRNNSQTISAIERSLLSAKEVSADYADKFSIIDNGLKGIFSQLNSGLNDYRDTVGTSLATYLGAYSTALTTTAASLGHAASKQEEILEELGEQLSKFSGVTAQT